MQSSSPRSVLQITSDGTPIQGAAHGCTAADLPLPSTPVRGLYVHVPFCFHKCHYCDFYSIVDSRDRQDEFVRRLLQELEASAGRLGAVETVFVGGGTPTLLGEPLWRELLAGLRRAIPGLADLEVTVEANPETVTPALAETLAAGGVSRVSVGAQSFDPRHLRTLERWHDPASVERSVPMLRAAGLRRLNLDLIFAIPGQTLADVEADLDRALALEPEHVSCYGLTYEPGTPLAVRERRGEVERADDELESRMYERIQTRLERAGFEHYEVSAWAAGAGERCRHNLLYWTNASWWPLGPSAAGHAGGVRWRNVARLADYLASAGLPPVIDVERLDADGRVGETLMLALRLREGIELAALEPLLASGRPARRAAIDRLVAGGRLERTATHLRLTPGGLLLADDVLAELL